MNKSSMFAAVFLLAVSSPAMAGGKEGSIGVGAEFGLNLETGGMSVNYDGGKFHFGGFLFFADGDGPNNTNYSLGGRFYYHIHSTAMSDFGIGGGLGFFSEDDPDPTIDRKDRMFLEPGFQIRLFLASNVALSFTGGISIGLIDASGGVTLTGQPTGIAGVHYYFF